MDDKPAKSCAKGCPLGPPAGGAGGTSAEHILKTTVDFRRVYASLLNNWLEVDSSVILGKGFETLPLFRNA